MQYKSVDRRENISDRITKHSVLEVGQRTAIEVKRKKNKIKQQQQFHATQTVDCYGAVSRSVVMHARLMVFVMSYERMQPNENRNIVTEIAYDAIHHANWIRWWSDWVTIRVVQSSAHRTVEPFEYFRSTICVDSICFFCMHCTWETTTTTATRTGRPTQKENTNESTSLACCLFTFVRLWSIVGKKRKHFKHNRHSSTEWKLCHCVSDETECSLRMLFDTSVDSIQNDEPPGIQSN